VVELPSSPPRITGGDLNKEYRPGDALNLTCESAPSNPHSRLEWKLNGRQVGRICKLLNYCPHLRSR